MPFQHILEEVGISHVNEDSVYLIVDKIHQDIATIFELVTVNVADDPQDNEDHQSYKKGPAELSKEIHQLLFSTSAFHHLAGVFFSSAGVKLTGWFKGSKKLEGLV